MLAPATVETSPPERTYCPALSQAFPVGRQSGRSESWYRISSKGTFARTTTVAWAAAGDGPLPEEILTGV